MTTTALAAAATLLAGAFAAATFERWLERRRRHELAWSVALAFFAAGALSLWAGAALGWDAPTFRLFYLFGAIVNVPALALGTVYLLAGRRAGDVAAAGVAVLSAFAAGVLAVAPLTGPIDPDHLPQGSDVFGPLPRVLAAVCSSVGALVVFGGAAWSAYRALRGRSGLRAAAARHRTRRPVLASWRPARFIDSAGDLSRVVPAEAAEAAEATKAAKADRAA
jgi:hypothetical protein